MKDWTPDLSDVEKPRYLAIADIIEDDIKAGRLSVGDRLPPQRKLAARLKMDFTTVARGYVEAQKRGFVESRVGQGTFVIPRTQTTRKTRLDGTGPVDLSMNLPPEPTDPDLLARMQEGLAEISENLLTHLRYQVFGGSSADKDAASAWLGRRALIPNQERVFVTPGAHAALTGILSILASPGDTVLCEEITYPGIRAIAGQQRIKLVGLPMDQHGIDPDAFADACKKLKPKALYLNPTLQNPTTLTIPEKRREAIAKVARRSGVPIVEDDAYGFVPAHGLPPFAAIAPDLTWHVAGLAKCIGAGLRTAYVVVPNAKSAWPFAAALRAANVMASPLTAALATRWIEDGTADTILRFIRAETKARQELASSIMPKDCYRSDPMSFNLWVELPKPWTRASFISQTQSIGIGVVASDAFTVSGEPIEAARICLGGPINRERLKHALEYIAHAFEHPPEISSRVL